MENLSTATGTDQASLPFPLRNAAEIKTLDADEWSKSYIFGIASQAKESKTLAPQPRIDLARIQVGQSQILAVRTTPCITKDSGAGFSTLALMYSGSKCIYRDSRTAQEILPGDVHLNPRNGGVVAIGYFSGILCDIAQQRLTRTMNAMKGGETQWSPELPYMFRGGRSSNDDSESRQFWALFSYIDQILAESLLLTEGLGLDEQIYRLLAIGILRKEGHLEKIQQRWKANADNWSSPLDDLVDYIRSNAHLNLTLTDLEEQSNYSGRHLQNLFKEKFDCTPMQFVRRQRLTTAMEKLQAADIDATVTSIAKGMGYRYTSNFCCDFQREFGISPSVVLRSSRGGGGRQCTT